MALPQSVSTGPTTRSAAAVSPSQTNSPHHSAVYTSAKIAGVVLFIVLCALIVVSAQVSGRQANDQFNEANKDSVSALQLSGSTEATASQSKGDNMTNDSNGQSTSGNSVSASISDGTVEVNINGQAVDVPEGSNYSKTTTDENGTTSVNISNNTSSTGSATNGYSYSSTIMSSNSSSSSSNGGSSSNLYIYTSP